MTNLSYRRKGKQFKNHNILQPKLSIITVNLNNAEGLRKTLESVAAQTFTNYEHLIIDGGSTDGSVEVIKKYEKQFNGIKNGLYWVSEPDKGIYNAMNKGIKVAKGEYCLFLNSGDWLIESEGLKQVFNLKPNEDIITCDILTDKNEKWIYPDKLSKVFFFKYALGHPSSFIKKELFEKFGFYNENMKIAADYGFFMKCLFLKNASYKHISLFLTRFDTTGISSYQNDLKEKEKNFFLKSYFPDEYNFILQYKNDFRELQFYRNSKPVQLIRKIQTSKFYKKIRKI